MDGHCGEHACIYSADCHAAASQEGVSHGRYVVGMHRPEDGRVKFSFLFLFLFLSYSI